MVKKETKVEESFEDKQAAEAQKIVDKAKEEPIVSDAPEPEVAVATTETATQKIDRELREKNLEIAELTKKKQESLLDSERVKITEHKHCMNCGRVFYNEDTQVKTCLICNPQRQTS